ncbi:hypothetical protein H8711_10745 [Clostridiaceae bacterium NSJ-31]|uniref:Uncharacterized protein n=2 Tax=Ligaoa zhengdingensis TaxID=2763658 RepID=A0A926DXU3_9FIRM|nr:hypothetical protein [Ligaoa zhengdingensis]
MFVRQLKPKQYERFCAMLAQQAHADPMEASRTVGLRVGGVEYAMRVQTGSRRRVLVLQALRIQRGADGPRCALVTRGDLLDSLLEVLLDQAEPAGWQIDRQ